MEKLLILATNNKHKVGEIKDILKDLPIKILSKKDAGLEEVKIKEDGKTLEENAIKKANSLAQKTSGIIVADDTGLFVDYLDGRPGVYSSRYSGAGASDEENNRKLLMELEGVPLEERTAYFKTIVAIITEDKKVRTLSGICHGKITKNPMGDKGFGYDPLFLVDGYNKTFAELGENVKNKVSHRAKALEKLKLEIKRQLEVDKDEDFCNK